MALEDDGTDWSVVRGRGRGRRRRASTRTTTVAPAAPTADAYPLDLIRKRVPVAVARLAGSDFHARCRRWVSRCAFLTAQPVDIVCYGIGRFGGSRISQYQFAFLSLLAEQCRLASPVMVYDPMLDVNERAYLEEVGFVNVARNEEGWRPVTRPTLFFMPHCGRALYNNVVGSNAHDLSRICIMGNRLDRYLEMDDEDGDSCFLREVRGAWVTDPCPAAFDDEDCAFNDFALQWFPSPDAVDRAPRSMPVTTSSNIIKTWQVAC